MIVVSGALVLVALVLLLIGLATPGLGYVYASIAVSAVAFGTLLLGFLQGRAALRQEETTPGSLFGLDPAPDEEPYDAQDVDGTAERDGAVALAGTAGGAGAPGELTPARHGDGGGAEDRVGAGSDAAATRPGPDGHGAVPPAPPVGERPDGEPPDGPLPPGAPVDVEPPIEPDEALLDDVAELDTAVAAVVVVVPGRPRYHLAGCRYLSGRASEECSPVDARERGFTPCGVCRPDARLVAEYEHRVLRAGSLRASPPAEPEAEPEADRPAKRRRGPAPYRGPVVVLSDRGRFHRPDCRYVREAEGTQQLTRTQALRLDYTPCGVCRP